MSEKNPPTDQAEKPKREKKKRKTDDTEFVAVEAPRRGRKPGAPKTGGRQKGTRNRNSMSVLRALDVANIPLIEFLIADIQCLDPTERVAKWFQIMGYVYPRLKMLDPTPALGFANADSQRQSTETPPPAPATPTTKEARLGLIHGQIPRQPKASG